MSKITTADCVQKIVGICQEPKVVIAAYCGGEPEDYTDPEKLKEAIEQIWLDGDEQNYPTPQDVLNMLQSLCTNPKNWKRHTKYKDSSGNIIRIFDCRPFDDQLRAYVTERDGKIIETYVTGE